jgi:hypothetical protein
MLFIFIIANQTTSQQLSAYGAQARRIRGIFAPLAELKMKEPPVDGRQKSADPKAVKIQ